MEHLPSCPKKVRRMTKQEIAVPSAPGGVLLVYAATFLQGLAIISFPGLSAVLKGDLGLSDAAYGSLFLPQIALAIVGAGAGGVLARRLGLKVLLVVAMLANALSQLCLALAGAAGPDWTLAVLMTATGCLGLGVGLFGAPLNTYPTLLFPRRADAALVAAHTVIGAGFAVGPFAAGLVGNGGPWQAYPAAMVVLLLAAATAGALVRLPQEAPKQAAAGAASATPLQRSAFWILVAIAVLYAFAEGTFSNWAVVYLTEEKDLADRLATAALSAFWAAMVAGRLIVSAVLVRLPGMPFWLGLPVLMVAAFLALPAVDGAAAAIAVFAFAGVACSAFFPLTVSVATHRFPADVSLVSALMIAAVMAGVGLGTFLIGALSEVLSFADLYRLSALYPAAALVLALVSVWMARRRPAVPGKQ